MHVGFWARGVRGWRTTATAAVASQHPPQPWAPSGLAPHISIHATLTNHNVAHPQVLDQYERTLDEVPPGEAYEHSEMLLYAAGVMAEGGRPQEALDYLDKRKVCVGGGAVRGLGATC